MAIDALNHSLANINADLYAMQAVIDVHPEITDQDIFFTESTLSFDFKNIYLYLAFMDVLMAQQEGGQPLLDVQQMAHDALVNLSLVEHVATNIDLTPPQAQALVILADLSAQMHQNQQIHLGFPGGGGGLL